MRFGDQCKLTLAHIGSVPLQDKGRLLVAGVGDSRCMLGRLQPDGAVRAVPLSIDHTPENPTEASRVRLHGVGLNLPTCISQGVCSTVIRREMRLPIFMALLYL